MEGRREREGRDSRTSVRSLRSRKSFPCGFVPVVGPRGVLVLVLVLVLESVEFWSAREYRGELIEYLRSSCGSSEREMRGIGLTCGSDIGTCGWDWV